MGYSPRGHKELDTTEQLNSKCSFSQMSSLNKNNGFHGQGSVGNAFKGHTRVSGKTGPVKTSKSCWWALTFHRELGDGFRTWESKH